MDPWKRRFLLETIISRFHVNFWGCNIFQMGWFNHQPVTLGRIGGIKHDFHDTAKAIWSWSISASRRNWKKGRPELSQWTLVKKRHMTYSLEVQRSLKEWVFTKDYCFSRDLFHQQFQGTIILMVLDFQGICLFQDSVTSLFYGF